MRNRIYLLLLVAIMATSHLMAQRGQHRSPSSLLTEEVKTELSLTAEQVTALAQLEQESKAALEALHERTDLDREGKHAASRELRKANKEKVSTILTEEQLATLRELREAKREEHRERMTNVDHKAMRAEIRTYHKTEIAPVMRAQRQQLEEQLSAEESQQLAEVRATLKAARQANKAERQERHAKPERPEKGARSHHAKGHKGHHHRGNKLGRLEEKHPEEFALLSAMVEKYDADITQLLAEIAPKQKEWEAAKKEIVARYVPAKTEGEFKTRHHRQHPRMDEKAELGRKIHFLLKDPAEKESPNEETTAAITERISANTYPNPAVNTTTLRLDVPQAAKISIDLRDEKGNLVKNIANEQFRAGDHELTIDLTELQSGTYYVTINSAQTGAPASVRLVVVK